VNFTPLALELLEQLGVSRAFANEHMFDLERALLIITDPLERQTELAQALAEMRDGQLPSIILRTFGGVK
jgi:hypothetical protein